MYLEQQTGAARPPDVQITIIRPLMTTDKKADVALITGASSGIGFELAKLFAADGISLVMVGNVGEGDLLAQKKAQIQTLSPDCQIIAAIEIDLSQAAAAQQLFVQVKQLCPQAITYLVNNAGFGDHSEFVDSNLSVQNKMMQLNMAAPVNLTHLFLPDMIAANKGYILNTVSVAGFLPLPYMSVYASTKAFLRSFTRALQVELKGKNISVTALHPGATATRFIATANADHAKGLSFYQPSSPQQVAKIGYKALMNKSSYAIPGLVNKLVAAFGSYFPLPRLTLAVCRRVIGN